MSANIRVTITGHLGEAADEPRSPVEQQPVMMLQSPSSSVSSSPGPDGFLKRKVEMKDGYLIVSEECKKSDSICTSVMGNDMDEWENVYWRHRADIVDKDGFICTPLHVVKELAKEMKQEILVEHYILKHPKEEKKIVYRVDIMIGAVRGVGQCTRKQLARQLAAIDVYEKIQLHKSDRDCGPVSMPRCGLLPGWRVDSMIYSTLFHDICEKKGLPTPVFQIVPPPENKLGKFIAICRIGDTITKGENDHPWLAKKLAAKDMYEEIAGNEFPLRTTLTGSDAIDFRQMRLLGFNPKVTTLKRKWMMEHRIKDTQVVNSPNEPDDGDMDEVEAEAQLQHSKKLKLTEMKETLKVTFSCRGGDDEGGSSSD